MFNLHKTHTENCSLSPALLRVSEAVIYICRPDDIQTYLEPLTKLEKIIYIFMIILGLAK